ncbi:MAG: hypothetical protein JSS66_08130 [Armatimonadetes bacterium]|nr:hypothetical protein [Armatimonadota bacterium]
MDISGWCLCSISKPAPGPKFGHVLFEGSLSSHTQPFPNVRVERVAKVTRRIEFTLSHHKQELPFVAHAVQHRGSPFGSGFNRSQKPAQVIIVFYAKATLVSGAEADRAERQLTVQVIQCSIDGAKLALSEYGLVQTKTKD